MAIESMSMKRLMWIVCALLLTVGANAQTKVIEKSAKKVPGWLNTAVDDYLIVSVTANSQQSVTVGFHSTLNREKLSPCAFTGKTYLHKDVHVTLISPLKTQLTWENALHYPIWPIISKS